LGLHIQTNGKMFRKILVLKRLGNGRKRKRLHKWQEAAKKEGGVQGTKKLALRTTHESAYQPIKKKRPVSIIEAWEG